MQTPKPRRWEIEGPGPQLWFVMNNQLHHLSHDSMYHKWGCEFGAMNKMHRDMAIAMLKHALKELQERE